MKYLFFILFLLSSPVTLLGQKIAVGLSISPMISFRTFEYHGNNNTILQAVKNSEKAIYTYSFGLNTSYSMSPRWQINTGLQYTKLGYAMTNIIVRTNEGKYVTDLAINYLQSFIDLPLFATYTITNPNKLISWYTSIGVINSFTLRNTFDLKTPKIALFSKEEISNINNSDSQQISFYNFSYRVGMGLTLKVDSRHSMSFEAFYRGGLSAVRDRNIDLNRYLSAVGLNVSFYKRVGAGKINL